MNEYFLTQELLALRKKAQAAAFGHYLRSGRVPTVLTELIEAARAPEAFLHFMKYNPHWAEQPRVPAERAGAGQWTDGGGGDDEGTEPAGAPQAVPKPRRRTTGGSWLRVPLPEERKPFGTPVADKKPNIDAAIAGLRERANPHSIHECAKYVRLALERGRIIVEIPKIRPGEKSAHARDYGPKLEKAGFRSVARSVKPAQYPPASYNPKAGDVVVIQPTSRSRAGHMAMYDGRQWISDFFQPDFWPGSTYRMEKPDFMIYRFKDR